ncbi:MAG: hypothetical protein AAF743_07215, partial [Planctomycetota bacterium]
NFDKIGELVLPEMADGKAELMEEMESEMADGEYAKYQPIAEAAINQFFMVAETFLSETDATTLGVSFAETGIKFNVIANFEEGSYIGENMGNIEGADASLLAGLPEMNYFVFGGSTADPALSQKLIDDIFGPIKAATEAVEQDEWTKMGLDYFAAVETVATTAEGQAFGMVVPQGDLGVDPFIQYMSVTFGDGEAIKSAVTDMQTMQQDLMAQLDAIAGGGMEMPEVTFEENAKTIAGVSFDSVTQANSQGGPEAIFFGPDGMVQFIGVADGKLIQYSGLTDEDAEAFIGAVRAGGDPLVESPGVGEVGEQLPGERLAVVYVRLDELVRTAGDTAAQFGMPIQVAMPPDLAPLGVTISSDQDALIIDAFLPSDTLQALVAQGMRTYMQMQGGGRGAGGGL